MNIFLIYLNLKAIRSNSQSQLRSTCSSFLFPIPTGNQGKGIDSCSSYRQGKSISGTQMSKTAEESMANIIHTMAPLRHDLLIRRQLVQEQ